MNTQTVFAGLDWAMEQLPFPALLLYGIGLGLLWLFIEALFTRTARATPKWRKPFPVLPAVSEAVAWMIRGSSWLLWAWALLYIALAAIHIFDPQLTPAWTGIATVLIDVAGAWRQTYGIVVGMLPPVVVALLPGV